MTTFGANEFPVDCHSVKTPLSLRHSRSSLPSALKSATCARCQLLSTLETVATFGVKPSPLDCHSVKVPPSLRHIRSLMPSPLKSPIAAIFHEGSTPFPTKLFGENPVPVEFQIVNCPVASLCQSRSALPSPLKSKLPSARQALGAPMDATTAFGEKLLPVDCHSVKRPSPCHHSKSPCLSPLKSLALAEAI